MKKLEFLKITGGAALAGLIPASPAFAQAIPKPFRPLPAYVVKCGEVRVSSSGKIVISGFSIDGSKSGGRFEGMGLRDFCELAKSQGCLIVDPGGEKAIEEVFSGVI